MKKIVVAILIVAFAGCGVEVATSAAIGAEMDAQAAQNAITQGNRTKDMALKAKIDAAIRRYKMENSENPSSLDDLVPKYLKSLPEKSDGSSFDYDSSTGKVSV